MLLRIGRLAHYIKVLYNIIMKLSARDMVRQIGRKRKLSGESEAAKELRMLEKAYTREMSEQLRAKNLHDSDADTAVRILQLTISSGAKLGVAVEKCNGFIARYDGSPPKKLTNMMGFIQSCLANYYFKQITEKLDFSEENVGNFYALRDFAIDNMRDHDGGLPAGFMEGEIKCLNSQAKHIEALIA